MISDDFEKDFSKKTNKTFHGKKIENARKLIKVELNFYIPIKIDIQLYSQILYKLLWLFNYAK